MSTSLPNFDIMPPRERTGTKKTSPNINDLSNRVLTLCLEAKIGWRYKALNFWMSIVNLEESKVRL